MLSDNTFEKSVATKLRETPGLWSYHPPDDRMARQWKPGDFIVGRGPVWGVLEAKEVQGETFPISRWSPQQRVHCQAVLAAGGRYWLVVRFTPSMAVAAFWGQLGIDLARTGRRASLKAIDGKPLNAGRTFILESLF